MKILALDIATHTGIAVGSAGRDPQCWSVDLGEGLTEDYRFSEILKLTHGLIVTHEPDLIICEAFIGGKNASAYLIGSLKTSNKPIVSINQFNKIKVMANTRNLGFSPPQRKCQF